MKILQQLSILFFIWAVGEFVSDLISNFILIPGSIIGMLMLFTLLIFGIVKINMIKETTDFLMENIAFFVIPAGVSLIYYSDLIKEYFFIIIICGFGITLLSMVITMKFVDLLVEFHKRGEKKC